MAENSARFATNTVGLGQRGNLPLFKAFIATKPTPKPTAVNVNPKLVEADLRGGKDRWVRVGCLEIPSSARDICIIGCCVWEILHYNAQHRVRVGEQWREPASQRKPCDEIGPHTAILASASFPPPMPRYPSAARNPSQPGTGASVCAGAWA